MLRKKVKEHLARLRINSFGIIILITKMVDAFVVIASYHLRKELNRIKYSNRCLGIRDKPYFVKVHGVSIFKGVEYIFFFNDDRIDRK